MKTTKLLLTLAAASGVLLLAGCATTETRINAHPEIFAQLTPQEQTMVRAGQVGLGFSPEAVKLALGEPDRVTVRTDAKGQLMVWHYVEPAYWHGPYLYGRPYWGGWGRWDWDDDWGWGGPYYPLGSVRTYDRFRVEFRNNKVIAVNQELRR